MSGDEVPAILSPSLPSFLPSFLSAASSKQISIEQHLVNFELNCKMSGQISRPPSPQNVIRDCQREVQLLQLLNSGLTTLKQAANIDFSELDLSKAVLEAWNFRGDL